MGLAATRQHVSREAHVSCLGLGRVLVVDAPSDRLREIYEERGRVEYAEVAAPDPLFDRKYAVLTGEIRTLLPCRAYLDAGCGDGRYLAALPSLGPLPGRIVGVDIAESILETARRACLGAGVQAELVRANLEALPFADGSFDVILRAQVIEHLLAPERGVSELARVLEPGGTLLLTTDNRANLLTRLLNAPRWTLLALLGKRRARVRFAFPHRDFRPRELEEIVREVGLAVEHVRTFRFHIVGAPPAVQRAVNRIDGRLPDLGFGDIVLVRARRL